jgi:hypothetical protein
MRLKSQKVVTDKAEIEKEHLKLTQDLIKSPFIKDRMFVIDHLLKISRDELETKEKIIESLFYDDVFKMALNTDD